jgi:raffinose/stachyose/melibiose transport system permease protein
LGELRPPPISHLPVIGACRLPKSFENGEGGNRMLMKKRRADYEGYLYIVPAFFFLSVFIYYGIAFNLYHSLFDWNGISAKKTFIGMKNYSVLLEDPKFLRSLLNTLKYMFITVSVQMVIGLLVAVLLDSLRIGGRFFKSLFFLPNIMSLVVIAVVFSGIYNYNLGFLNEFLRSIGLESWTRDWVGSADYALYSVMVVNIFTYMGFSMMLYITGLTNINHEIIEAARIDGAGFWSVFMRIIVPLLRRTHTVLIILGIIGSLKTFDIVWLITQGGPARASEVVSTYLFRSYVLEYKGGYSAAISIIVMLIALTMTIVQLTIAKKLED